MIFLEQTVNQILREEGQVLLSLNDLGITWDDLEQVFVGTYEQAKPYITIYDWVEDTITATPTKKNFSHVRHITYNTQLNLQRAMPDVNQQFWEYNPWTKNMSSFTNTKYSLEVGLYPTLDQLTYNVTLNNIKKGKNKRFILPCTPVDEILCNVNGQAKTLNFEVDEVEFSAIEKNDYLDNSRDCPCNNSNNTEEGLNISGDINGTIDFNKLIGNLNFNDDYNSITLTFLSKYLGIKELDMSCELFYNWFKSNVLMLIGSVKTQIDLSSSGLPFDFNADSVLQRAKELRTKVDDLKLNKSNWSNF